MTKIRKTMVVILLLLYVISSAPLSVFAVNEMGDGTVITEEIFEENQETIAENETTTEEEDEAGTEEAEQEIEETEIDPVFDESGYDFSDMAPDLGDYCDTDYDYTDSTTQYDEFEVVDDFDDNIDAPTFEPGYDFSDGGIALTAEEIRTTENKKTIQLSESINGEDFKYMANNITLKNALCQLEQYNCLDYPESSDITYFFAMQGSCFGECFDENFVGGFWYYAFTVNRTLTIQENAAEEAKKNKAEEQNEEYKMKTYKQEGYVIVTVPENNLDNFLGTETRIAYFEGVKINKINDITYNTINKQLVIAACVTGNHDAVYTVPASTLLNQSLGVAIMDDDIFTEHAVSCNVTSIAFSEKDGLYIVGLTTKLDENGEIAENNIHRFAKLDCNFNLIKTMGEKEVELPRANSSNTEVEEVWNRQTIFVDNNYIYNLLHIYDPENPVKTFKTENMIEIYDLDGNYKKSIYFYIPEGTDRRYEAENINIVDGRLYIGFNCAAGLANRAFCYYDFTENGFSITYCPDDDISTHITDGSLTASFVVHECGAKLFTNPFSENGKAFQGWHAYRKEVDKWFYVNADKTTGWYKEGQQPAGYTKYRYGNKATVSQTGRSGEHVYMCAQWADSNNFTVFFASPDVTNEKYSQTIVHGTPTALMSNEFIKTGRTHKGWNAYWVEKKKWLYVDSATGKDLQWCVAGSQPAGYKKYVYSDGETVSKTVHKGNQVIMYAVWDEFFIYYNPNGRAGAAYELLPRKRGWNSGGNVNSITPFSASGFKGYNMYCPEVDKWLYYNSNTQEFGWFEIDSQTSGYSLYLKTFNNGTAKIGSTVPYGHSLVLYAKW